MSVVKEAISKANEEMSKKYRKEQYKKFRRHYSDEYVEALREAGVSTLILTEDEYTNPTVKQGLDAAAKLYRVWQERPDITNELKVYRKYVPEVIKSICRVSELNREAIIRLERYETDGMKKRYKRWTKEEDEELINLVCDDSFSMLEISTMLGRTVPSIKTRVSKLVGLKRLSQEVAGRFIGMINGNHANCVLDGTVYKDN